MLWRRRHQQERDTAAAIDQKANAAAQKRFQFVLESFVAGAQGVPNDRNDDFNFADLSTSARTLIPFAAGVDPSAVFGLLADALPLLPSEMAVALATTMCPVVLSDRPNIVKSDRAGTLNAELFLALVGKSTAHPFAVGRGSVVSDHVDFRAYLHTRINARASGLDPSSLELARVLADDWAGTLFELLDTVSSLSEIPA
jgi:hypothetical protein